MPQQKKLIYVAIFFTITLAVLSIFLTPYMLLATGSYLTMILGLIAIKFKKKTAHIGLMTLAIITDIGLVLTLELQRDAIDTATSLALSIPQLGHIFSSSVATALYIPTFVLGYIRWKKPNKSPLLNRLHLKTGATAFIFRTVGFILMFSMLSQVHNNS